MSKLISFGRSAFKAAFEGLYLHESINEDSSYDNPTRLLSVVSALPQYTKYMLIAGYLASYLPPKLDLKKFTQLDRRNVTKQQLSGSESANVEPKAFTVD